jgi:hypothetical protein
MEIDDPVLKGFRREWRAELGVDGERQHSSDREMNGDSLYAERGTTVASTATLSTATVRGDSAIRGSSVDIEMSDAGAQPRGPISENRFIVAIDFGTTFSSVSFIALSREAGADEELNSYIYLDQIQSIINYPDEPRLGLQAKRKEVPTEIWYPKHAYMDHSLLEARNRPTDITIDDLDDNQIHNRDQDPDEDVDMEPEDEADDEENKDTFWGYEVQKQLRFPDTNRNQNRRMSRFKLLLDESDLTQKVRDDLEPNWKELTRRKIIKHKEDVIAHYLKYLFSHAKEELIKGHGFSDACPVEFVLCVPPIWTPKACRIMQTNMEKAIRASEFGSVENDSVDNLFIVSEPEAAAAYVLASTTAVLVSLKSLAMISFSMC